jgi:DNA-directed RNA polymerase subunit K/omega
MVQRPLGVNAFEFAVVSGLRAAQPTRGCLPRIKRGHKNTVTAQLEVAAGKVRRDVDSILARVD